MIFSRPPFVRLRSSKLLVLVVAALVASLSLVLLGGGVAQAAAPQPTTTASCQSPPDEYVSTPSPLAQTFTAQKSGKLTSARVTVGDNGNYLLQILGVDQNGTPSQVLASKTVPVSGATGVKPTPVVASYDPATAPTLEAGKQYAIGVDKLEGYFYLRGSYSSTCPSKGLFYADTKNPGRPYTPTRDSGGYRPRFDFSVDVTPPAPPTPTPSPAPGPTPKPTPAPAPATPGNPAPAPAPGPINVIDQSQGAQSGPVNQSASIPDNNKGGGSGNDQAAQQQLLQTSNTANQQNEQAANQFANQNTASGPITGNVSQANNISQSNDQSANASPRGSQQSSSAR